ncbi:Spy/CpxP family protein refolding chaperone [Mesorhizobium sp. BAC0120]|uniref:Spy/CpxP family protein refolding chaperone n=1 Tax=Mesorhizobium sp. BAC0120 TaxID=3090670 RepID=UPI00298C31D4|nr:Spy/CpxP family protein refolding chaperone [Mesorhizobium sp. BAC0120]MDW6023710.1 Spy/CpxP family protein refolding chaperone [Mesorhizobium sp. BAC0120]
MSRFPRTAVVALLLTGSSVLAHAQAQGTPDASARQQLSATEMESLTDARIAIVKFALQMTPEQEKLWPAVEEAIRSRAAGRQARLAAHKARIDELRDRNAIENWQNRDPVDFLRRRADALAQRAAEVKRLADAWQPLFETLSPDQRRRLAVVAVFVFRDMRDQFEDQLLENFDTED